MNTIDFIPVNIRRQNCVVYSNTQQYPLALLERAVKFLRDGEQCGVYYNESGEVKFADDDTISWSLANIYLAYNAYVVARDANMSFYTVLSENKIPELFISSQIHNGRIVVNAHSMQALYITHPVHRNKLSALIDKSATSQHCYNLFTALSNIETGKANYLHSLVVNRDQDNEVMHLSPILTPGLISEIAWTPDLINALRRIHTHEEKENEYFDSNDSRIITKTLEHPIYIVSSMASYVLETYDKLRNKKSNYFALKDENGKDQLYVSTNMRYVVQASSFRVMTVTNQQTRGLLKLYATSGQVSYKDLYLAWEFALMG